MDEAADDALPAIALLTGPDAARTLAPALPAGTRLESLTVVQVTGSPGKRSTVRYDAEVLSSHGRASTEMLVAAVDRRGLPEGPARVHAGGEEIAVWRAQDDPRLPALRLALNPDAVLALFRRLGTDAGSVALAVKAYRPGTRAVVEATVAVENPSGKLVMTPRGLRPRVDERRLFLKVMRPPEHEELAEVHARLGEVMPVPRVLGRSPDGLLIIDAVPGATLRSSLRRGLPVPPPSEVVALAAAPGGVELPDQDAETSDDRVRWALGLLRANLPDQRDRLDRLAGRLLGAEPQPKTTIHGDFHEGQILVQRGVLMGIIDLDDAGLGELVEDLGLITGRLWTLARERGATHIEDYVVGLLQAAERHVPLDELRRRVGVSLFARATAPFRNQTKDWRARSLNRLGFCEEWLDRPV